MKHEPGGPDGWEPPWMRDMRKIEDTIRERVDTFIKLHRRARWVYFVASIGGYWVGFVMVELLKWATGLK